MKVYCGRSKKGIWKASLDRSKIESLYLLFETDLEIVHSKVYFIEVYYGYDYGLRAGTTNTYVLKDVISHSQLYHSICSLKKNDKFWKEQMKAVEENPDDYIVTPVSIASNCNGQPFIYGDVMEDKFNARIIGVPIR